VASGQAGAPRNGWTCRSPPPRVLGFSTAGAESFHCLATFYSCPAPNLAEQILMPTTAASPDFVVLRKLFNPEGDKRLDKP